MATPVVTSKWAGNFDCSVCRRKRLMAEEFSKNALTKHRKTGEPLRCKQCTAKQEQEERSKAKEKASMKIATATAATADNTTEPEETRKCAGPCQQELPQSSFNRNQFSKGQGKSRCRSCVEKAIQDETALHNKSKDDKIEEARQKVEQLKLSKSGATTQQVIQAESELAALEAEKVTGLKPIKLSSSRGGKGRFGASGRGRGRSSSRR